MPRYPSSVDGAELFYRYYAPEGRTPALTTQLSLPAKSLTLVFLHQCPLSSRMYDSILLSLCETHEYRVVDPDRRGFGNSDWAGQQSTVPIDYKELGMSTGEALTVYLESSYVQKNCQWDATIMALRQDRPNFIANGFKGPSETQIPTLSPRNMLRFSKPCFSKLTPSPSSAEVVQKSGPGTKLTIYDERGHVLVLAHSGRLLDDIVKFAGDIAGPN